MAEQVQTCANCDRKIGRLEQSCQWQGHTVCLECHERLSRTAGAGAAGPLVGTVVGAAAASASPSPAAASAGPESTRWSGSPAVVGYVPLYAVMGVLAVASLVAALWVLPVALLAPVCLLLIGVKEILRRSVRYTITTKRVVHETGILSKGRQEVRISDIREVTSEQTLIGRIFGFGTVGVDTAANAGAEIRMENIPDPRGVVALLHSLRG
jgi:membrane protein YdbS with pleckstrin-like domain